MNQQLRAGLIVTAADVLIALELTRRSQPSDTLGNLLG